MEDCISKYCRSMLKVVDCRVCGDPNSVLRFAFIEFTDEGMLMTFILSFTYLYLCNYFST